MEKWSSDFCIESSIYEIQIVLKIPKEKFKSVIIHLYNIVFYEIFEFIGVIKKSIQRILKRFDMSEARPNPFLGKLEVFTCLRNFIIIIGASFGAPK